jgi:hypothetical protein
MCPPGAAGPLPGEAFDPLTSNFAPALVWICGPVALGLPASRDPEGSFAPDPSDGCASEEGPVSPRRRPSPSRGDSDTLPLDGRHLSGTSGDNGSKASEELSDAIARSIPIVTSVRIRRSMLPTSLLN